jgi:hypothetical protein
MEDFFQNQVKDLNLCYPSIILHDYISKFFKYFKILFLK